MLMVCSNQNPFTLPEVILSQLRNKFPGKLNIQWSYRRCELPLAKCRTSSVRLWAFYIKHYCTLRAPLQGVVKQRGVRRGGGEICMEKRRGLYS
jgi:hypothetical protein